jgi:hypothetical protein
MCPPESGFYTIQSFDWYSLKFKIKDLKIILSSSIMSDRKESLLVGQY